MRCAVAGEATASITTTVVISAISFFDIYAIICIVLIVCNCIFRIAISG